MLKKVFLLVVFSVMSVLLQAQPRLVMDDVRVLEGEEVEMGIYLENIGSSYAYSSVTARFYYDSDQLELLEINTDESILRSAGTLLVTENFPGTLPTGSFKKISILQYGTQDLNREGLIARLRFRQKSFIDTELFVFGFILGEYTMPESQISGGHIITATTPEPPQLRLPVNNAEVGVAEELGEDLTIAWDAVTDQDGDEVRYEWQMSLNSSFFGLVYEQSLGAGIDQFRLPYSALWNVFNTYRAQNQEELLVFHRVVAIDQDAPRTEGNVHTLRLKQAQSTSINTDEIPASVHLSAAYPNPFNPSTRFSVSIDQTQRVFIDVYDMNGSRVAQLHNGVLSAGEHPFFIEAANWPSGIYVIKVVTNQQALSRKITLIK